MSKIIKSIGKKPVTDKIFGTNLTWEVGESHEVEDDSIANKIVKRFGDVLAVAKSRKPRSGGNKKSKKPKVVEVDPLEMSETEILYDQINRMDSAGVKSFVFSNFGGFKFDEGKSLIEMKNEARTMVDRFGVAGDADNKVTVR